MDRSNPSGDIPPAQALRRLVYGHRVTQLIATAAQLRIADHLSSKAMTATELSALVGAHPSALHRLLRALAAVGVVSESAASSFSLTAIGDGLRSDAPSGMRDYALFEGAEYFQRSWCGLRYSVETGQTASTHMLGSHFYQYMNEHPEALKTFSRAMVDAANLAAEAVVSAFDFSSFRHVVDIGGGYGILLTRILVENAALRGSLFDLPSLRERAESAIQSANLSSRCEFFGGDYFQSALPGGDLFILSRILMGHSDEDCVRILRNCHRALERDGRILIIQQVIPEPGADSEFLFEAALSDLNMLVMVGGQDRSDLEYRKLLSEGGFVPTRTIATSSLMSIVEAAPA